jgi:hypothetical protein
MTYPTRRLPLPLGEVGLREPDWPIHYYVAMIGDSVARKCRYAERKWVRGIRRLAIDG